jgi:hypothetical protein
MYLVIFDNMTGEERGRVREINGKLVATTEDPFVNNELNFYEGRGLTPEKFFEKLSNRNEMNTRYVLHDDDESIIVLVDGIKYIRDAETKKLVEKKG